MEKDISCKWKKKKAEVAVPIPDKIDFKTKAIIRDKGHYIMIKGTIQQEDITPVNIYTHNMPAPKYAKQILVNIKEKIDRNTVIVGDFDTSLTSMDRTSRQKSTSNNGLKQHTISDGFN